MPCILEFITQLKTIMRELASSGVNFGFGEKVLLIWWHCTISLDEEFVLATFSECVENIIEKEEYSSIWLELKIKEEYIQMFDKLIFDYLK